MDSTLKDLDAELVNAAKGLHLLSHISWPIDTQKQFLAAWHRGQPTLPKVEYEPLDLGSQLQALQRIATDGSSHNSPIGNYISETALSYLQIGRLMQNAGKPEAGDISIDVYGKPGSTIPGSSQTNLDAAQYFLDVSSDYRVGHPDSADNYCLPADVVARDMSSAIGEVITNDRISIEIDPGLAAKATAGATRIRLRDDTCFSEYDVIQLLQHEAFVHSLTALNGRYQKNLTSLSLAAPRTTAAQEGLATFAELVTGAIDISRMSRLAMRVKAIDAALSGADFIEVFRFFIETGGNELESYNSAARVFRGVPATGGHAFTKDVVYLTGLLEMHTFFRWTLANHKMNLCQHFFAGRMKLADVLVLEPEFESGVLQPPTYLPPWMTQTKGLTAYLAFSVFADGITVAEVGSDAFNV